MNANEVVSLREQCERLASLTRNGKPNDAVKIVSALYLLKDALRILESVKIGA